MAMPTGNATLISVNPVYMTVFTHSQVMEQIKYLMEVFEMETNLLTGQFCFTEVGSEFDKVSHESTRISLKERIEEYGPESLLDTEIMSLLTGVSIDTLKRAIDDFGIHDLIKFIDVLDLSIAQRRKMELLNVYYKRVLAAPYKSRINLGNSAAVGNYAITLFVDKAYECFILLCLDSQNRLIKTIEAHQGTLTESPVYPRIIVELALKNKANSLILVHNHPGGSLVASGPDRDVTKRLKTALDTVSITVVDHVIVADDKYLSFAESGLL
jgi:DNA repair protein RadC